MAGKKRVKKQRTQRLIQTMIDQEVAEWIRARAQKLGLSVAGWVRMELIQLRTEGPEHVRIAKWLRGGAGEVRAKGTVAFEESIMPMLVELADKIEALAWKKESYSSRPPAAPSPLCSVCGEPQYWTASGNTCKNGHGGAPAAAPRHPGVGRS
jgi:hypothetical protein